MAGSSKIKKPEKLKYFDYSLLFVIIFLVGFGLVMLYSVSSYEAQSEFGDAAYYLKKQLAAACLGLVAMFIVSRIDYHVWQKLSLPVYGLALLLCVAVLFLGSDSNGSSRWFRIGGLSVQPSEIAKIAVIIFTAALLCKTAKQIAKLQNLIKVFCFIAPIVLVIAVNNLSTAIIVAGIAFIMVFVVSPKYTHFIAFAAGGSRFYPGAGIPGGQDFSLAPSGRSSGYRLSDSPGTLRHRFRRPVRQGTGSQYAEAGICAGSPERYDLYHYL